MRQSGVDFATKQEQAPRKGSPGIAAVESGHGRNARSRYGPLLAPLDAADRVHEPCAELIAEPDLVIPALILGELDYWRQKRFAGDAWLSFLRDVLDGTYRIEHRRAET